MPRRAKNNPEDGPVEPVPPPLPPEPPPQIPPPPRAAAGHREPEPVFQIPPMGDADLINNIVARELADPMCPEVKPDPTLETIRSSVTTFTERSSVEEILADQDVIQMFMDLAVRQHNFYRLMQWLFAQNVSERIVWKAIQRGDINTPEAIALMRYSSATVQQIIENLKRRPEQERKIIDVPGAVNALRGIAPVASSDDEVLNNTTPHGREIIRKRLFAIQKQITEGHGPEPVANTR